MRPSRTGRVLGALALLAATWLLAVPRAEAATTCTATSPTLAFGTVSPSGNTDVQANFSVTCNTFGLSLLARARVTMCLSIGTGVQGPGQANPRIMRNAQGDPLAFQIFQDPARSVIWGSRTQSAIPTPVIARFDYAVPLLGGSQTRNFTLYGRIPAQASAAGGFTADFRGVHTLIEFQYNEALLGTPSYPASCISGGTAGQSTAFPFTATATIANRCTIDGATTLDFGTVPGLLRNDRDQTSAITLTCTGRTPWAMSLGNGQNATGVQRRMRRGTTASYVNYQLYRDPQRSQRWGGTGNVTGTGTGTAQSVTVYGRVPGAQVAPPGQYRDVVTVTVTY